MLMGTTRIRLFLGGGGGGEFMSVKIVKLLGLEIQTSEKDLNCVKYRSRNISWMVLAFLFYLFTDTNV